MDARWGAASWPAYACRAVALATNTPTNSNQQTHDLDIARPIRRLDIRCRINRCTRVELSIGSSDLKLARPEDRVRAKRIPTSVRRLDPGFGRDEHRSPPRGRCVDSNRTVDLYAVVQEPRLCGLDGPYDLGASDAPLLLRRDEVQDLVVDLAIVELR